MSNIETLPNGKSQIIVTELPYLVNKARLIEKIADLVKDNPGLKLKVTGYADSDTGSAAWNKQLSEDRANNVANELVKLGVNKNNLIISGMGGVNTLTPPAFNRRVIIEAQ